MNANNKTALNLENTGTFLVRNQNNETKNVAISHFNNGIISNTTGEYVPHGTLSSASSGIVHGQLLGVKDFNHSGVLDLTGA
ncbi:hypothetical protein, partial [Proteus terrae]|uniref:hypothetical protein n=1 Tax=Proteus terrae TaxID=1574161 RepID=UPI0033159B14